jgi:hypothetical protein
MHLVMLCFLLQTERRIEHLHKGEYPTIRLIGNRDSQIPASNATKQRCRNETHPIRQKHYLQSWLRTRTGKDHDYQYRLCGQIRSASCMTDVVPAHPKSMATVARLCSRGEKARLDTQRYRPPSVATVMLCLLQPPPYG